MGYNLGKRLSAIKDQVDADQKGRLRLFRAFLFSLIALSLFASFYSRVSGSRAQYNFFESGGIRSEDRLWQEKTKLQVADRIQWLRSSWIAGGAETYRTFANEVLTVVYTEPEGDPDKAPLIDIEGWLRSLGYAIAGTLLRVAFLLFALWPLWIVGAISGFVYFRLLGIAKRTDDVLGVCTRGLGPFYSGIFGIFRTNTSVSGTDLSCPNLACPDMASKAIVEKHALMRVLKTYGALNETNTGLCQVIVAYRDFPAVVDEERGSDDESDTPQPITAEALPQASYSAVRNNLEGTIEQSALEGLQGVLSAHRVLQHYFKRSNEKAAAEEYFSTCTVALNSAAKNLPPLGQRLLLSLTPSRGKALAGLPPQMIASACLAIEAGKSLVYKRDGAAFNQVSRFPHLQARAVLQSITSYHREYRGDPRLIIRQAIICSRRHGDFGRSFLPGQMPIAARALRDWLEILYAAPKKRGDVSYLVELDSHIEEISHNWRRELTKRLEPEPGQVKSSRPLSTRLSKGILYKSVVLLPLKTLLEMSLRGVHKERLARIHELIAQTRKLQENLSISARLPGFKRQAFEAERMGMDSGGVSKLLSEDEGHRSTLSGWVIVRRMLTRYNWLSTRVGDDAVPVDGLVQGVVIDRAEQGKATAVGLDMLVPLRQRRFREILGNRWELTYYADTPRGADIEVYVVTEEYSKALGERKEQASKGLLDGQRYDSAGYG